MWIDQGSPVLFDDFVADIGVDLDGWYIDGIFGISGDGSKIYGSAIDNTGNNIEGFVLTIPAPASASVLALGVLAFRRKR